MYGFVLVTLRYNEHILINRFDIDKSYHIGCLLFGQNIVANNLFSRVDCIFIDSNAGDKQFSCDRGRIDLTDLVAINTPLSLTWIKTKHVPVNRICREI